MSEYGILTGDDLREWADWLESMWEGFGPWVPDDCLTEAGAYVRGKFLEMLLWDSRALPHLKDVIAELERRREE
jgi:hypothetical protein